MHAPAAWVRAGRRRQSRHFLAGTRRDAVDASRRLKIDLPVSSGSPVPACNVACISPTTGSASRAGPRDVHLRPRQDGMFLPILDASKVSNGKKMIGMVVEVWTND
jgi:hypothetical protein